MALDGNHRSEGALSDESREPFGGRIDWKAGGFAGFAATAVMGVAIVATDATVLRAVPFRVFKDSEQMRSAEFRVTTLNKR